MGPLERSIDALFARPPSEGVSLALVVMRNGEVVAERYGTQPANAFQPENAGFQSAKGPDDEGAWVPPRKL